MESTHSQKLPQRLIDAYFQDYAGAHRHKLNQLCHYFGIPMIATSLLGLLAGIVIAGDPEALIRFDGGTVLLCAAVAWYLFLDWKLAVPFSLFIAGMYFLGRSMPVWTLWTVQAVGWVFQGIGHYAYEKKSPAFFKNLEHVLIGPLWIFAKAIGYKAPGKS